MSRSGAHRSCDGVVKIKAPKRNKDLSFLVETLSKGGSCLSLAYLYGHECLILVTQSLSTIKLINEGVSQGSAYHTGHQMRYHYFLSNVSKARREMFNLLEISGLFHGTFLHIEERLNNPLVRGLIFLKGRLKVAGRTRISG